MPVGVIQALYNDVRDATATEAETERAEGLPRAAEDLDSPASVAQLLNEGSGRAK